MLESDLSKIYLRELISFVFVTFFARPKKVTKEKTPKSNARDGLPRFRCRFQPSCALVLALAEIGTHAITSFARSRDFGSHPVHYMHSTELRAYSMESQQIRIVLIEFSPH